MRQCTAPGSVLNGDLHRALRDQRSTARRQNQQHPCPQHVCLHTHSPHPSIPAQCSGDLKSWASNLEQSAQQLEEFNLDTGLKPALSAQDTPFRPKGEGSPVYVPGPWHGAGKTRGGDPRSPCPRPPGPWRSAQHGPRTTGSERQEAQTGVLGWTGRPAGGGEGGGGPG